jgi:hypothetical protein
LSFYDLLKSYADQRYKTAYLKMTIERPAVYAMEDALVRLQRLIGEVPEWTKLETNLLKRVPSMTTSIGRSS